MWETTDEYCDVHESYMSDENKCECHLMILEDKNTDYEIDLWRDRLRG